MTCPREPSCYAMPDCEKCGKQKAPVGRSIALAMGGMYCDHDCLGYLKPPFAGHLWPGENQPLPEE